MKKILVLLLAILICLSVTACGIAFDFGDRRNNTQMSANLTPPTKEESSVNLVVEPDLEPESELQKVSHGIAEFDALLSQMPVFVKSTQYIVQHDQYKALYPDMLQAVLQNNTSCDIKNALIAFVAWDENNLPVKIKGSIDFSDGAYIKQVNYSDINMIPGSTFGESSGFEVDEACGIKSFKAIVVSFETFDGDTWNNPYYDEWCSLYEDVKLTEGLAVDVLLEEVSFESSHEDAEVSADSFVSEQDLLAQIDKQELKVISTQYIVQHDEYKSLYPDMLQAVLQNNTSCDIKNAVIAFVAWDENNLPVKIKGSIDFSDGAYIKQVNYSDINMIPGSTFGESSGFEVDEACGIKSFKAIVVSYEAFDGTTWKNPLFDDWCKLYEGAKLK